MDRISSASVSYSALADLSRAQRDLVQYGQQSASQKKADDLKGFGYQTQTLVSAERLVARATGYMNIANELRTRMEIQDVALGQAASAISQLREDLFQNVSLNTGVGVSERLEETFVTLKQAMNLQLGGQYLFGGGLNDRAPVIAGSVAELVANPLEDAIQQGATSQKVRIEEWQTVDAGPVAVNVINDAFASIKRLAEIEANTPYEEVLSVAQRDLLETELANLSAAFQTALGAQAEAGRQLNNVDKTVERQQAQLDALNAAVGDIVGVDLAEVAVKLNQAQFAYEASASVFSTMKDLSLLNFLS